MISSTWRIQEGEAEPGSSQLRTVQWCLDPFQWGGGRALLPKDSCTGPTFRHQIHVGQTPSKTMKATTAMQTSSPAAPCLRHKLLHTILDSFTTGSRIAFLPLLPLSHSNRKPAKGHGASPRVSRPGRKPSSARYFYTAVGLKNGNTHTTALKD